MTYEVAGKEKTVFTSPARGAIQCSSGGDPVPRALGNRAGIPGYQKRDAAQRHHAEKQESGLGLSGLWGLLLGYNLVRREASQAAVAHQRAPNEVSFKFACQFIANQMAVMAGALSPAHTPRRLAELRGCIGVMFIEKRPRPSRPRAVKISKTRFPVNRKSPDGFVHFHPPT